MKMTVGQIADACSGKILYGDPKTVVTSVSADSRKIEKGALFVPIIGEKNDAHKFIPSAFKAGAAAVLSQEPSSPCGKAIISVKNTLTALQSIAAAYRNKFSIPFIGVTGSVGKTTTREMTALALSSELNVMKTHGNFNSQIGLPLTMFSLDENHEAAVMEMGMSNFGEMERLAKIARPDFAVVTNIGLSHIGQLKTKENIMKEKLHIADCFGENSAAFLNGDDEMLYSLKGRLPFDVIYYGTGSNSDFRAVNIETHSEFSKFEYIVPGGNHGCVTLPVPGKHYILDALAALAVCARLGVSLNKAAAALSNYRPLSMRQQIRSINGITVIDDSYNSSPDALKESINVLSGFKGGKRIAVLADMLELGDFSQKAHFSAGIHAAKSDIDSIFAIGEHAKAIADGAFSVRPDMDCRVFGSNADALMAVKESLSPGDTVLVKGSRGMHTDEIVKGIMDSFK